jgi:prepilin-type N-terminal cleavage/methylation domain-containing protein
MKFNKGFTLIELLVSISIIVILSLIVMAALGSGKDKGNDSKIQSHMKSMVNQAQLYTGLTGTAVAPMTTAIATAGDGTGSRHLFNSNVTTENSLLRLDSNLPAGTIIYYGWDGVSPVTGGKWFFAATTSFGAFCVDYTGLLKKFTGSGFTTATSTWTTSAFTRANSTYYDCQ